jgi:aryl-alcohol dehydrogenase-like predicted oxidoreductase
MEILPLARHAGLAVTPYSPLGGGLLTGKYTRSRKDPSGRLSTNGMYSARYGREGHYRLAEDFLAYAAGQGADPVTLAVAWVASHPAVTAPIIGARNLEQLAPSLAAGDYDMSDAQREEISALSPAPAVPTDRDEERDSSA